MVVFSWSKDYDRTVYKTEKTQKEGKLKYVGSYL